MRVADIRVPRLWPLAVLVSLLTARRSDQALVAEGERIARELGETINHRWRTGDERADEMLALTRSLTRLTWALFAVAASTLLATGLTLVVALA